MKMTRQWAMPNKNTFLIDPIHDLIKRYISKEKVWIDPFANESCFNSYCKFTNDLLPEFPTTHHMDALNFLQTFKMDSVEGILYDPVYSVRQLAECYKKVGKSVTSEDTRPNFWTDIKKEIARILKPGGLVISCGWNSGGIGISFPEAFVILEILLVPHGGIHFDTIVVVERKTQTRLF